MNTFKNPNICACLHEPFRQRQVAQIFHVTHLQLVNSSLDPAWAGGSLDLGLFIDAHLILSNNMGYDKH